MFIEQPIDIPAHPKGETFRLTLEVPRDIPQGKVKVTFTPLPAAAGEDEPLPRITRAQLAQWREERMRDPVWQELNKPLNLDWSWLPEGITPETLTKKDIREMRLKDKYGI